MFVLIKPDISVLAQRQMSARDLWTFKYILYLFIIFINRLYIYVNIINVLTCWQTWSEINKYWLKSAIWSHHSLWPLFWPRKKMFYLMAMCCMDLLNKGKMKTVWNQPHEWLTLSRERGKFELIFGGLIFR